MKTTLTARSSMDFAVKLTTRAMRHALLIATICLAFGLPALAQFDTGTVSGSVTDPTGAIIPQASVTIRNLNTSIETKLQSDGAGNFVAPGLPSGRYEISAAAENFGVTTTKPFVLNVGATVHVI